MKQDKMTEGVYPILAVPHPAGQRREWVVNKTLLRSVKLGVVGVFFATLLLAMNYHIAALNTIRVENLRLSHALSAVQDRLYTSFAALDRLSNDDHKLRVWAEIQDVDPDTHQLGVGDGESASPAWAGKVERQAAAALQSAFVDLGRLIVGRVSSPTASARSRLPSLVTQSFATTRLPSSPFQPISTSGSRPATSTATTPTQGDVSFTTASTSPNTRERRFSRPPTG